MSRTRFTTGQKLFASALDAALDELEGLAVNAGTVRVVPLVAFVPNNTQTVFALVRADTLTPAEVPNAAELLVTVNGFQQRALVDFTVAGTNIVFVVAPTADSVASAVWLQGGGQPPGFVLAADGVTNDAPAIQALIDGTTGDLAIRLPAGRILLGSTILTPSNRNITVTGAGKAATTLKWVAGLAYGWRHGATVTGAGALHLSDMTWLNTTSKTGIACWVSVLADRNPTPGLFSAKGMRFGDGGTDALNPTWHGGVEMYGAWNAVLDDVDILLRDSRDDVGSFGIGYSASLTANAAFAGKNVTTYLALKRLLIQGGQYGLDIGMGDRVLGNVQGVYLSDTNIIGQEHGIRWLGREADGPGLLSMVNSHANCSKRCILMDGATEPAISNNLFLRFDQFNPAHQWACIEGINSAGPTISNNFILTPGGNQTSNVAAIYFRSTTISGGFAFPGTINDNTFVTLNKCPVELEGTVSGTAVINNDFRNIAPGNASNKVIQTPAPAWTANTVYAANSAVVANGYTYTTPLGGTSANTGGPSGTTGFKTDGTVTWTPICLPLPTINNSVWNRSYGAGQITTDIAQNLVLGGPTSQTVVIRNSLEIGKDGIGAVLDLHAAGVDNDFDARIAASGGTQGTSGVGVLTLAAATVAINAIASVRTVNPDAADTRLLGGSTLPFLTAYSTGLSLGPAATVTRATITGATDRSITVDANFTNTTGSLAVGGARAAGSGIELGSLTTASGSFIDGHSSGTGSDFDVRLAFLGGSSTAGTGTLTITGRLALASLAASASFANDAAAATGGVAIGELYRTGSGVSVRVV